MLKGIPVVSTLSSICKIGYNLHERNLIKQTLAFITEFNSGSISQEKLTEHREKLETNPKEAEKELGRVLIILGNQVEQIQSQVLGSFYAAYVKGAISWEKFCELSEANRRMFISDYQILFEAAINDGLKIQNRELYQVDRLISLGLLQNQNRLGGNVWIEMMDNPEEQNDIIVTSFGKTFYHNSPAALKRKRTSTCQGAWLPRRLKSYFAKIASPRLHEGISRPFGAWNPSAFAVQVFDCKFGAVLTSQPSSNRSKK